MAHVVLFTGIHDVVTSVKISDQIRRVSPTKGNVKLQTIRVKEENGLEKKRIENVAKLFWTEKIGPLKTMLSWTLFRRVLLAALGMQIYAPVRDIDCANKHLHFWTEKKNILGQRKCNNLCDPSWSLASHLCSSRKNTRYIYMYMPGFVNHFYLYLFKIKLNQDTALSKSELWLLP